MKRVSILAMLVLILAVGALPAAAITWGEPDTEHVNVGAMMITHPVHGVWEVCSGTLIHPRVFLTAGHCTDDLEGYYPVYVTFAEDAYQPPASVLLAVEEVITHPDFGFGDSNPSDVGALILAEPVEGIEPATLPELGLLDKLKKDRVLREGGPEGAKFVVVGYGGTLEWPPPVITYYDQRQMAVSEYIALTKVLLHMSQNSLKGDSGTCFGDSGGPAFWVDPDGNEILVGITSTGDAQCVATGFDYRVDIPDTLDFIEEVIAGLD